MAGDRVAGPAFDLAQGALELVVGERLDLAAVVADEMVVVLAVRVDRLEAGGAGADVDPLHEAVARQLLERAVDARDADAATFARGAGRRSPARSGSSPGGRAARSPPAARRRLGGPCVRSAAIVVSAQRVVSVVTSQNDSGSRLRLVAGMSIVSTCLGSHSLAVLAALVLVSSGCGRSSAGSVQRSDGGAARSSRPRTSGAASPHSSAASKAARDEHDHQPGDRPARLRADRCRRAHDRRRRMVIVNGIGYDPWAQKLLASNPVPAGSSSTSATWSGSRRAATRTAGTRRPTSRG